MGIYKNYRQAKRVKKNTSRDKNKSWYLSASEQITQIHFFIINAEQVRIELYRAGIDQWENIKTLPLQEVLEEENWNQFADNLLAHTKVNSNEGIGIIVHASHELNLQEGRRKYAAKKWEEVNELLVGQAQEVLDDPRADEDGSLKRALPLARSNEALPAYLVCLVKDDFELFLRQWRKKGESLNIPIITSLQVSPILLAHYIPELLPESPKPHIVAVIYNKFTLLLFYGEVRTPLFYRAISHYGNKIPNNFLQSVQTTADQLEIDDYDLSLVSPSGEGSILARLKIQLERQGREKTSIIDWKELKVERLEFAAWSKMEHKKMVSHWAVQNFETIPDEELNLYPSYTEMKLLSSSKFLQIIAIFLCVTISGKSLYETFKMTSTPEWSLTNQAIAITEMSLKKASVKKSKLEKWDSLLEDRSEGWEVMELVSSAFPGDKGTELSKVTYIFAPLKAEKGNHTGHIKKLEIRGRATEKSRSYLAGLNSQDRVMKVFNDLAEKTQNDAFNLNYKTRNLVVNINTKASSLSSGSYPIIFDAEIQQRNEPSDVNSLKVK